MNIAEAVAKTRESIEEACRRSGRRSEDVLLMGVSKFHDAASVRSAWNAGVVLFGESRVQEAKDKFPALQEEFPSLELHLIGSLQRNKAKVAVDLFDCVQSADRDELVLELAKRAEAADCPLDLLLELHTGEESKAGYPDAEALYRAAELCLSLPSIRLRGLMTMAPYTQDEKPIRASFRALVSAKDGLARRFPEADWSVLSMGMSNDFEIAVEEGSTLVRVGTAIFGRPSS
jgi:pyridoxal phosphate enzyme (YggS family)